MRFSVFVAVVLFQTLPLAAETWPQFRGPDGQGHAPSAEAPRSWNETENVTWNVPISGPGWSSPVVWGNQIWMTTAVETPMTVEACADFKLADHVSQLSMHVLASVSLRAICVDRRTGKLLFEVELFEADSPPPVHSLNSYASPTQVIEEGRVFCHFGAFGTACVDTATGDVLWRKVFPLKHYVGPDSSPVICGDLLILTCDGADQQYVVAVDKHSGERVWKMPRPPIRATEPDFRKSYCTPLAIDVGGKEQLVIPGAQWTVAYEPQTGKELWMVDHGRGFSIVPRPVYDGERLFFCTGFMSGSLWAVRTNGTGIIPKSNVEWTKRRQIPTIPSPLLVDDRLYIISDGGVATCFATETGDEIWRKRIPGKYSASLLYAAGQIYAFSQEGVTTVFAPGDTFEELAINKLPGKIMATPAVVKGAMFLRTNKFLYRIEEAAK